ncbi:hypothetical protein M0R45_033666 [Rubus argutus]|uniref:Uncharacterized protein n=1 Tax=Rubus argutus TaxID=59490 RepID=A0AAW1WMZ0_RUBAR
MESYKHLLSTEGCSSSESGWTTYIASPMEENEAQCSYDDFEYNYNRLQVTPALKRLDKDDNGGDDSMASDASSGPSHHQHHLVIPSRSKESTGIARFKRDMKQSKNKSTSKQEKKGGEKGTKRK